MTRLVIVVSLATIAVAELVSLALPDRRIGMLVAGALAAMALVTLRWLMTRDTDAVDASLPRDPAESLRRWLARTETLIEWSDSTRSDWDKRLRPMLARQFELATGQRKSKDPRAFQLTAELVFGDELWKWVDPDNVSSTGATEPGPGRAALGEILQRLERV